VTPLQICYCFFVTTPARHQGWGVDTSRNAIKNQSQEKNMARYGYTPPEAINARKEAQGRQMTLLGAVLVILGGVGIILSTILKVVWLGILGGPLGGLAWLALLVGGGVFWWGFTTIRDARASRL